MVGNEGELGPRARSRALTHILHRSTSAVRGYRFRILHIVGDRRLIDIFVGSRSLEFRVCAHVVAASFLARTYRGRISAHFARRHLCAACSRSRATRSLGIIWFQISRDIPVPAFIPLLEFQCPAAEPVSIFHPSSLLLLLSSTSLLFFVSKSRLDAIFLLSFLEINSLTRDTRL